MTASRLLVRWTANTTTTAVTVEAIAVDVAPAVVAVADDVPMAVAADVDPDVAEIAAAVAVAADVVEIAAAGGKVVVSDKKGIGETRCLLFFAEAWPGLKALPGGADGIFIGR